MSRQLLVGTAMLGAIAVLLLVRGPPLAALEPSPEPSTQRAPMVSVRLLPQSHLTPRGYSLPYVKTGSLCLKLHMGDHGDLYLDESWRELTDENLRFWLRKKQLLEEKNGRYVWFPSEQIQEKILSVRGLATALNRLRLHADPDTPTVVGIPLNGLNKRKP